MGKEIARVREDIIDLLHWEEYGFVGQDKLAYEGSLTQESEEQIATSILSLKIDGTTLKELLEKLDELDYLDGKLAIVKEARVACDECGNKNWVIWQGGKE